MFTRRVREKSSYLVVFDVNVTGVGVALARATQKKGVHSWGTRTLWHTRAEYAYHAYKKYEQHERAMVGALLEVGMKMLEEGVRVAKEKDPSFNMKEISVHCVLSAPWSLSAMCTYKHTHTTPVTVDEKFLDHIATKVTDTLEDVPGLQAWRDVVGKANVLTHTPTEVRLEGYPIAHFLGKHARDIQCRMLVTFVGADVHQQITNVFERIFSSRSVTFHTTTHFFLNDIKTRDVRDVVFVEAIGHMTTVALARNGALLTAHTIPIGVYSVLHALAPKATNIHEAHSALQVALKKCKGDITLLPHRARTELEKWRSAVMETVTKQAHGITPPTHLCLLSGLFWHPLLLPALTQQWSLPGVREKRVVTVTCCGTDECGDTLEVSKKRAVDSRLEVFTGMLQDHI